LLRLYKRHNIAAAQCLASVRVFRSDIGRSTPCAVVIALPAAKAVLCPVLNFISGGKEDEADSKAGIWVLTESQARSLCALRTLGDLLYAHEAESLVSENDWQALVQSIAAGNQGALHALYERTHRIVFTLVVRITNNCATADEVTLDAFHAIWRCAPAYDPASATVLGWVMNQACFSAIRRLRLEQRKKRLDHQPSEPVAAMAAPDSRSDPAISCPADLLSPSASLRERLARRVAAETGGGPVILPPQHWAEPEWREVAPGISCKLLAIDTERDRVSMLVRLATGVDYPPHIHGGVEELHLLDGELWIDGRKLYPGERNRAEAGTADKRVWSETGCTCVLVTSARDLIN